MSWQDYVDAYLVNLTDNSGQTATNVCEHGAIVSTSDGSIWASTPGFALEGDEFAILLDVLNAKGGASSKGGITFHGQRYHVITFDAEKGIMYLKRLGGGAAIAKSNTGIVIGIYNEALHARNMKGEQQNQTGMLTNRAVETLQTFLLENSL